MAKYIHNDCGEEVEKKEDVNGVEYFVCHQEDCHRLIGDESVTKKE